MILWEILAYGMIGQGRSTYDEQNRLVTVKTPSKKMQYVYDSIGRVQSISDGNGNTTSFDYEHFTITDAEGVQHFLKI